MANELELGSLLRRLRKRSVLTLEDVRRETGVPANYLSGLETGTHRNPTINVLKRLANLYGLPVSEIVKAAERSGVDLPKKRLGKKSDLKAPEQALLDSYRQLGQREKSNVQGIVRGLAQARIRRVRSA